MSKYIVVSDEQYAVLSDVAEKQGVIPGQVLAELIETLHIAVAPARTEPAGEPQEA